MTHQAASFFAGCQEAFAAARRRRPGPSRDYRLAGHGVTLEFAGESLPALILPALALEAAEVPLPGLRVALWDFDDSGIAAPAPPWRWSAFTGGAGGRIMMPGFDDPRFRAVLGADYRLLWMLARETQQAIVWSRGAPRLPAWEHLHPLRLLLHAWLRDRGLALLHAGSVGTAAGGALIAGSGGAGKSTTVLAALAGGLTSAGDDYVALESQPAPRVHALYGTMRLFADHAACFPGLLPANDHEDSVEGRAKLAAYVGRHRPAALVGSLPLLAVVAPRVSPGARPALEPLGADEALAALAPSTLQQLSPDEGVLVAMTALCRRLPCRRLVLGRDLDAVPHLLAGLIAEAESTVHA